MTTEAPYRVWCLSWDQDEDDGKDIVGYDILTHDYTKKVRGVVFVASVQLGDAGDAAEAYADYIHSECDGCEDTWPLTFRVRGPDGVVQDFSVDRDYEPVFRSRCLASNHMVEGG